MCEEHPRQASALRERFERLVSMGLVGGNLPSAPLEFPDRLGDFKLVRKIGGGGMGVVYLAEQESRPRRVAVKVIRPDRVYYSREVARFRREVEAVAKLRHPGIVSLISVGQDRDIPFFAMEWLEGATLFEILRCFDGKATQDLRGADLWKAVLDLSLSRSDESSPEPPTVRPELFEGTWVDACLRITRQIADVLHYSHKQGIVHRDIKPSNIWITPTGRTVLIDFGLARTGDSSSITRTGTQLGSLLYMSPEQISGSKETDERTDIYSLGVTLYECLALRSPFEAGSSEATARRIVQGDARAPRTWNRGISPSAQTVCLTAMSRRVMDRYRDAGALSRDLNNVLANRPIDAKDPSWIIRQRDWTQRHPAAALGLLLLVSVVFFALFTAIRERTALRRIQLLADSRWIESLTLQAQSFWPMDPNRLGAIDNWLDEVTEVRAQHEIHERELLALRRRALPYAPEDATRDRAPTERTLVGLQSELSMLEKLIERSEDRAAALRENAAELTDLKQLIEELSRANTRRTWTFAERSDEWRHESLTRLIEIEFRNLVALEVEVREHRRHILEIHRRTILAPREKWAQTIEEIASLPIYRGLRLAPQMGLIPIRRSPQSGLWEFVHVMSGDLPMLDEDGGNPENYSIDENTGLVMVLLPGGSFRIGARHSDGTPELGASPISLAWERPTHSITLEPFFLSKYEMTVGQFDRLGGELVTHQVPSSLPIQTNRNLLARIFGQTWLRFPTEAQWEYACRGGTSTAFYTGDSAASLLGHANFADRCYQEVDGSQSLHDPEALDDGFAAAAPVGSFLPNPFGLHDVHGNANEWIADVFVNRAYKTMEPRPGDGLRYFSRSWLKGLRYGVRGGAYWDHPAMARSARRSGAMAEERWQQPGVRPMRKIQPEGQERTE